MKIGIDARAMADDRRVGKGHYVANLISALAKVDQTNQYVLYTDKEIKAELPENWSVKVIGKSSLLWHLAVKKELARDGIDTYLSPTSYIIPAMADDTVMVVHDLVSFLDIVKHQPKAKWMERITLPRAIDRTKKIVTVSESTKKDLLEHFQVPESKVEVIYNSGSPSFKQIDDSQQIRV